MTHSATLFDHLQTHGDRLHARVLARDDLQLAPWRLSRAAAARLRAGIAALESWLRRVLLLLALELEPTLTPRQTPYNPVHRPCTVPRRASRLRVFPADAATDPHRFDALRRRGRPWSNGRPVHAAPLLSRLARLKALVDAPQARARRLAFHIARRRPGPLFVPAYHGPPSGRTFGPEISAVHAGLAAAIVERSRARPPPLGPALRLGPRARWL
ncbi:MAG: hypothetical protein AAF253_14560 [Pseudomonadota bacterium]